MILDVRVILKDDLLGAGVIDRHVLVLEQEDDVAVFQDGKVADILDDGNKIFAVFRPVGRILMRCVDSGEQLAVGVTVAWDLLGYGQGFAHFPGHHVEGADGVVKGVFLNDSHVLAGKL